MSRVEHVWRETQPQTLIGSQLRFKSIKCLNLIKCGLDDSVWRMNVRPLLLPQLLAMLELEGPKELPPLSAPMTAGVTYDPFSHPDAVRVKKFYSTGPSQTSTGSPRTWQCRGHDCNPMKLEGM